MANDERSFIMIKPDGVQRGLVGEIIKRFEQKGFSLKGLKLMNVSVRTILPPPLHADYARPKKTVTHHVLFPKCKY